MASEKAGIIPLDVIFPDNHIAPMSEPAPTILQIRLAELLKRSGEQAAPLGERLGLSKSFVRDILRGKTRSPRSESLDKLAGALGTTTDYLLGKDVDGGIHGPAIARQGDRLRYAGVIQAGQFLSVNDFNQDHSDIVPDYVLADMNHGKVRQYAYKAAGDSMNEAGILDGMWVVAADAADYVDVYGDVVTGDLVVVERSRYQGSERELTVKEVHFFRDRYELRPVSSNTEHKPITVPHDHTVSSDGEEVKIVGVVLTAYANLRRRRTT